jgi:flagellar biosynthesis GTPase FlhF
MHKRLLLAPLLGLTYLFPLANGQEKKATEFGEKKPGEFRWELLSEEEHHTTTKRARVEGGWLYKVQSQHAIALTFVPDRGPGMGGFVFPPGKQAGFAPGKEPPPRPFGPFDQAPPTKPRFKATDPFSPGDEPPTKLPTIDKKLRKDREKDKARAAKEKDEAVLKQREAARALEKRRQEVEALQAAEAAKAAALRAKSLADLARAREEAAKQQALAAKQAAEAAERARAEQARRQAEARLAEEKARREAVAKAEKEALRDKFAAMQVELEKARDSEKRALREKDEAVAELRKVQAELEASRKEAQRLKPLLKDREKKK